MSDREVMAIANREAMAIAITATSVESRDTLRVIAAAVEARAA